jgi:hypothetical protein
MVNQPTTDRVYIINIQLAVNAVEVSNIKDGISEMLGQALDAPDTSLLDWQYGEVQEVDTPAMPVEEGELFTLPQSYCSAWIEADDWTKDYSLDREPM